MKIKGLWEGIPGFWIDDPQSPDGRRWIATHYGWELIQKKLKERARERCELVISDNCQLRTQWGDAHHVYGRGGGKRDDRLSMLKYACRNCHAIAKIERRLPCSALLS